MSELIGRRLPDVNFGELPSEELKPGDYWKCLNIDLGGNEPTNLTRQVWQYYAPNGDGIGTLISHTVREHDDGTISVIPGDGSSNSILHRHLSSWHGYIDHGRFYEV